MQVKRVPSLAKPVKAAIQVPGSKSIANRALLCAALAKGASTIDNLPDSEDVAVMLEALPQLGARVRKVRSGKQAAQSVVIAGTPKVKKSTKQKTVVHTENAGTATRFMLPHIPSGGVLTGNRYMQKRPIGELVQSLQQLGMEMEAPTSCPPVQVLNNTVSKRDVVLDSSVSSQYVSSLMMFGPKVESALRKPLRISRTGKIVSQPYVKMTQQVMQHFGATVRMKDERTITAGGSYVANDFSVPADASSATYWWALAAITGSVITTPGVHPDAAVAQADTAMLAILQKMGCTIQQYAMQNGEVVNAGVVVSGPRTLKPITVDMRACPDAVLSVAIVAACADGTSLIKHIAHLEAKETNRLTLLRENLHRVGIRTELEGSTGQHLRIYGNPQALKPAIITTDNDHRFAMAFAILGQRVDGMHIEQPQCVRKSYANFWNDLRAVQRIAKQQNIVLIGMRGTGKSTVGAYWAKRYNTSLLDTDDLIEQHIGTTIQAFVAAKGWSAFRKVERQIVKRALKQTGVVVSLGGGAVLDAVTQRELANHLVVFIYSPVTELHKRLRADHANTQRPAFADVNSTKPMSLAELRNVWNERKELYYSLADYVLDSRNN